MNVELGTRNAECQVTKRMSLRSFWSFVSLLAIVATCQAEEPEALQDLSILKVGNYLIQQGHHAHQISMQCEALGVAPKVWVAAVESLYYHAPMVGAHRQKGLQEEAWLPFIRGEWDGKGRVRLNNKKPETRKAFVKQPPDMVLLMADLNGRHRHGVQGKGDEYYAHLVEVMKFYAKTCKENGARLVLWIHPGKQQAHDVIDRKTKEAAPITEEEYAADLAAIQGGLDKLIGIPAARHFKHLAQEDLLLTEDAHKAIIDAVWKGTTEAE